MQEVTKSPWLVVVPPGSEILHQPLSMVLLGVGRFTLSKNLLDVILQDVSGL
ncbi:hypothetical protein V6Z12_A02G025200 [Gossypium hirsutum]